MPDASEEEKERIRQTPTKLCRLTWTGDPESWIFAFYKYSDERYEPSIIVVIPCCTFKISSPDGTGRPETDHLSAVLTQ